MGELELVERQEAPGASDDATEVEPNEKPDSSEEVNPEVAAEQLAPEAEEEKPETHAHTCSNCFGLAAFWTTQESPKMESEEDVDAFSPTRVRQNFPFFVCFQVMFVFGLWFIFAIKGAAEGEDSFLTITAGLDSIWNGRTDLRLHDLCHRCTNNDTPGPPANKCESYGPQVWRWWTYQYTHGGLVHVITNCIMTILFGTPLEGLHGTTWLAFMFNVGIIGGAMCYFVFDAHRAVVGTSGGCYALLGIHVANLIMNWDQIRFRIPLVVFIIILIIVELASYATSLTTDISNASHIGGAVAGLIIGIIVGENIKIRKVELIIQISAFCLGLFLVLFCMIWLAATGNSRNLVEGKPWCWLAQVWHEGSQSYKCVECGEQSCIDGWLLSAHIYETTLGHCRTIGYLEVAR